jgi:hypothetical protein
MVVRVAVVDLLQLLEREPVVLEILHQQRHLKVMPAGLVDINHQLIFTVAVAVVLVELAEMLHHRPDKTAELRVQELRQAIGLHHRRLTELVALVQLIDLQIQR